MKRQRHSWITVAAFTGTREERDRAGSSSVVEGGTTGRTARRRYSTNPSQGNLHATTRCMACLLLIMAGTTTKTVYDGGAPGWWWWWRSPLSPNGSCGSMVHAFPISRRTRPSWAGPSSRTMPWQNHPTDHSLVLFGSSSEDNDNDDDDRTIHDKVTPTFPVDNLLLLSTNKTPSYPLDWKLTGALIGGQSALIGVAMLLATLLHTPNVGWGTTLHMDITSLQQGFLYTLPLGCMAILLDVMEEQFPALQDVTKATQRSVLSALGSQFQLGSTLVAALALGLAAGIGEELLFRGVIQYELVQRVGPMVGVLLSSLVFGLLHPATPLYMVLAGLASIYFGAIFLGADQNLVVPMSCHALYDFVALVYAHWTVCQLSPAEQVEIMNWDGTPSTAKAMEKE